MQKAFKHPLARKATTVKARLRGGGDETLLIVLTTMELDSKAKGFSRKNSDRLHDAAQAFVAETESLAGYAIINRPKEWDA